MLRRSISPPSHRSAVRSIGFCFALASTSSLRSGLAAQRVQVLRNRRSSRPESVFKWSGISVQVLSEQLFKSLRNQRSSASGIRTRRRVDMLVLVNAMIPKPGETAEAWGENTGSDAARKNAAKRHHYSQKFEEHTYFFHDVPKPLVEESAAHEHDEAPISFSTPCDFEAWPDIPTHVLVGADDRLFPAEFQERVARERLHLGIEMVDGGHLAHLSNPEGVAWRLLAHARELEVAS